MAQGRSTKTISMIKWTRTSRLSIKISLSLCAQVLTIGHTCAGICICAKQDKWPRLVVNPECAVKGHSTSVNAVAFSPDAKQIVSGGQDMLVKIWNAETGAEVRSSVEMR